MPILILYEGFSKATKFQLPLMHVGMPISHVPYKVYIVKYVPLLTLKAYPIDVKGITVFPFPDVLHFLLKVNISLRLSFFTMCYPLKCIVDIDNLASEFPFTFPLCT